MMDRSEPERAFLDAACVPMDSDHASGTLAHAEEILAANPDVRKQSIYCAAVLGDHDTVSTFLASDGSLASARGGPRDWDAITYLCFSRYLRLDSRRSDDFVKTATALLDAGASANSGWFEQGHLPEPQWESAIYGAAGVAHHASLTRLLLERGADPNDEETPYHVPETYDNAALKVLVESGKLTEDSLAMILLRKTDWHDYEGIKWLLERGVKPDTMTRWGKTALQNAIISDNDIEIFRVLLDHGANPLLVATKPERFHDTQPRSVAEVAARRGRADVLRLFAERGIEAKLEDLESLLAACALSDANTIAAISSEKPELAAKLAGNGGNFVTEFAGNGNTAGVNRLIELGVPANAVTLHGDPYFAVAANSTALHAAAWRARHDTVKLLIEKGADVNARDAIGRTPLQLAVKACVDSYWTARRSPESIAMLLSAGASPVGITLPTGYDKADELLNRGDS